MGDTQTPLNVAGLAGFALVVLAVALDRTHLGVTEALLLFGPLVVVPLGLPLVTHPSGRLLRWSTSLAAITLIAAFALPASATALVLSLPWLVVSGAWAVRAVERMLAASARHAALVVQTVAVLWLPVAAAHMALSRAGVTFAGIPPPLIELGGVHFTFAGFGATALAACLVASSVGRRRSLATAAAVVLIAGSSLVGLGHMTVRPIELVGTAAVTVGVMTLAALGWNGMRRPSVRQTLLRVSGLAVVAPMGFALAYSWALTTNSLHLPYETIAAIHGSLNAVGFVACGLLAWRLDAAPREALAAETVRPRR